MRAVKTSLDGRLLPKEVSYFGGSYSFWEKLAHKGIGSAKVLYEQGIPEFDQIDRGLSNELSFVSFELLKDGLLLRLNQNQRLACVGTRLSDLERIKLEAFRIGIKQRRHGRLESRIVHRGELSFHGKWGSAVELSILSSQFESLLAFFERPQFKGKFDYSVSTKPPEKDYGYLVDLLDIDW